MGLNLNLFNYNENNKNDNDSRNTTKESSELNNLHYIELDELMKMMDIEERRTEKA